MRESHRNVCSIRPADPGDYAQIAELAGQLQYPSTSEQIRARLAGMAESNDHRVYVAEIGDAQGIVGWIGLFVFRSVEQDACAEISGLIIDERARSDGIGKALLEAAAGWARSRRCKTISVHSNVVRERAHRFYEQNGYEHVKTQKYFVRCLTEEPAPTSNIETRCVACDE